LQNDLVLEPLRGRGMVVRRDSVNRCTKARDAIVGENVRLALSNALAGGISADELREIFESELSKQAGNGKP
jgi:GntR family transcriptional regulator